MIFSDDWDDENVIEKTSSRDFTEEDLELLKKPLPANPCDCCHVTIACRDTIPCPCENRREYKNAVRPYRDAGIYKYAEMLRQRDAVKKNIAALNKELDRLNGEILKVTLISGESPQF